MKRRIAKKRYNKAYRRLKNFIKALNESGYRIELKPFPDNFRNGKVRKVKRSLFEEIKQGLEELHATD